MAYVIGIRFVKERKWDRESLENALYAFEYIYTDFDKDEEDGVPMSRSMIDGVHTFADFLLTMHHLPLDEKAYREAEKSTGPRPYTLEQLPNLDKTIAKILYPALGWIKGGQFSSEYFYRVYPYDWYEEWEQAVTKMMYAFNYLLEHKREEPDFYGDDSIRKKSLRGCICLLSICRKCGTIKPIA